MPFPVVRAASSKASSQYIDLFDGDWDAHEVDAAFIRPHLHQVPGPVLDLGSGPGYWTAYLHSLQVRTTGVDVVPEFTEYARAAHPGPQFRLGSITHVDAPDECVAGILSWFSTIHMSPADLSAVLTEFRRLLAPAGMLVLGFEARTSSAPPTTRSSRPTAGQRLSWSSGWRRQAWTRSNACSARWSSGQTGRPVPSPRGPRDRVWPHDGAARSAA
jgi:SAM-dependent methyltransferase